MSSSPNDPDNLSLDPSKSSGKDDTGNKPDFSRVTGSVESTAGKAEPAPGPDFSKVQGSSDSTAKRTGGQSYTVKQGDNLSAISKKVYGNANRWQEIFEANRDQLDNPDLIHPGQTLKIP